MPATGEALVKPAILRWARGRARISQAELAKKLNTKQETIALWENGDKRPTFRQAQTVANKLRVPFGYLFLSAPPEETIPLPDFRTVKNAEYSSPTANFLDLLYDVLAKQSWYREFLEQDGAEPLPFVAKFSLDSDIVDIADNISSVVGINDDLRRSASNWEEFLSTAIEKVEHLGILVMRSGLVAGNTSRAVSTDEFRGFTISDDLAPLIFINTSDAKAGQIFTLAHELAHLWTGQTGISNEDTADFAGSRVEDICNKVATEILVPEVKFRQVWASAQKLDDQLNAAVHFFRVSSLVVLRRTLELRLLPPDDMWRRYREEKERFRERPTKTGGGKNTFFYGILNRNSSLFTKTVIDAVRTEQALYTEAASLLNVRVATIPKIANFLEQTKER